MSDKPPMIVQMIQALAKGDIQGFIELRPPAPQPRAPERAKHHTLRETERN